MGNELNPKLTGQTRLKEVLDKVPGAVEYLVGLNRHDFSRLQNEFARKYMAPRITLERIAVMAGLEPAHLIANLEALAEGKGLSAEDKAEKLVTTNLPLSPQQPPRWLTELSEEQRAKLHVVDLLAIDTVLGDPFPAISQAVKNMRPGEVIRLHHRWQPQPLYDIWQKMRLEWFAQPDPQLGTEEWHIFVYKPTFFLPSATGPAIYVELRHLPLNEDGPRVVTMLEQLKKGQYLEISGASKEAAAVVRETLDKALSAGYTWQPASNPEGKEIIKITPHEITWN